MALAVSLPRVTDDISFSLPASLAACPISTWPRRATLDPRDHQAAGCARDEDALSPHLLQPPLQDRTTYQPHKEAKHRYGGTSGKDSRSPCRHFYPSGHEDWPDRGTQFTGSNAIAHSCFNTMAPLCARPPALCHYDSLSGPVRTGFPDIIRRWHGGKTAIVITFAGLPAALWGGGIIKKKPQARRLLAQ